MKDKRNLIILALLLIGGAVGISFAYFSNATNFVNEFQTSEYGSAIIEKIVSPDGWMPGSTIDKYLKVKNTGEVDEAVKVSYTEKWVSKNGEELPLIQDNQPLVQVHWINTDDWIQEDKTYYYKYKLTSGEETSKLFDYILFNPATSTDLSCVTTTEGDLTIKNCGTSGDSYDGAIYTITFTINTVQYNKYTEAWNTDIVILENHD
ncbi:MAG: hypothetical protein IJR82_00205 [Bacilli bacterium]|nr:hypothetical protein [Bacilli bacterium]